MKKFKKMMAIVLSLAVVLAFSVPTTFAADGKTITLTGGKAGHTYTLYQVLTGEVKTVNEKEQLTNLQWGSDVKDTFKAGYSTAAAYAKKIAEDNDARATAQKLVGNDSKNPANLEGGTPVALSADGNVVFSNLDEGYYVIVDTITGTVAEEGDYSSAFIVEVVKDVNGKIKGSGATSDKKVKDASGANKEGAAYNIGDDVPFELKATTADNVAAYKKYHITFQDKQSTGLDDPTEWTVSVLGKDFTVTSEGVTPGNATTDKGTKITVTKETPATGNTFAIKVEFEPTGEATYLDAECNSTDILVNYTAKLNSSAVIGSAGNPNDSYIDYSNNPEDEDGGDEGKTPPKTPKVFTFKTVIDKVDPEGAELKGAGFTIYQEVEGTTTGEGDNAQTTYPEGAVKGSDITFADGVEHSAISADKYYVAKAMTLVSGKEAQFEFKGLADGKYVLVETTIPEGFNAFKSVEFTISSTITNDQLTALQGGTPFTTTNAGVDGAVEATKIDETKHALDSGELYAEIENNSGAELPSTGGIGTTIFYVLGALLVVGAGVLLVTRRRMKTN